MTATSVKPLHIQLWSYNYDPEPTGIAPLKTTWAKAMAERGHKVDVVAAHPHYPEPVWGTSRRPYREMRDGISVTRLPLWIGRESTTARIRQELSFAAVQTAAIPALGTPDVILSVTPSFPALAPAMVNAKLRRVPWVVWIKDILPDGALATGIVSESPLVKAARRLEKTAYAAAAHIIVISDTFVENLTAKGVPADKVTRIYDWATRPIGPRPSVPDPLDEPRVLCMGNIGYTQGLVEVTKAFQADEELARLGARLVIAGTGVAAPDVKATITTDRVEMTGLLFGDDLEREINRASVGAVTQSYEGKDFNVPSKLMNYMAVGLPVVGCMREESEAKALIERSGAGWTRPSAEPAAYARMIAEVLQDPEELRRRGEAGLRFAREELSPESVAERSEEILRRVVETSR